MTTRCSRRLITSALLAVVALAAGCGQAKPTAGGTSGGSTASSGGTTLPPSSEVSWSGTAIELKSELAQGSYKFKTAHQGKWMVVSGTAQGVSNPMEPGFRTRFINLATSGQDTVGLEVNATAIPPGKLVSGQKVKLKGVLREIEIAGLVKLSDCEILDTGPSPALQTTADEILEACRTGTALEKYKEVKPVILTGTIDEVARGKGLPNKVAVFKGKDGWTLECTIASGPKDAKTIAAGQAVKLIGSGVSPATNRKIASVSFCELIEK